MAAAPRLATRGQRRVWMAQPARTGPAGSWGAAFSSAAARHVAVGVRGGRGGGMQENNKMAAARRGRAGEGGGGEGVVCALETRSIRKGGVRGPWGPAGEGRGAWAASACPEPQGAVSCSPAASPRARVQDSLPAVVTPFLPLRLAFPFPGERLDQGEVELEPRGVGVRELGPGAAGPFHLWGGIQTRVFWFRLRRPPWPLLYFSTK